MCQQALGVEEEEQNHFAETWIRTLECDLLITSRVRYPLGHGATPCWGNLVQIAWFKNRTLSHVWNIGFIFVETEHPMVVIDLWNSSISSRAGRRGLMESMLGSRDRVHGVKSRSRRSGFFLGLFFFFFSSYPAMCTLSLSLSPST